MLISFYIITMKGTDHPCIKCFTFVLKVHEVCCLCMTPMFIKWNTHCIEFGIKAISFYKERQAIILKETNALQRSSRGIRKFRNSCALVLMID